MARPHAIRECTEAGELRLDIAHNVVAVDRDRPARAVAQRHVQYRAAFCRVDLLAAEHGRAAIGPGEGLRTIVGRVHDDGVVLDLQVLELRKQLAHLAVMLHHAVGIETKSGFSDMLFLHVSEIMHSRGVEPTKEWLARTLCSLQKVFGNCQDLFVNRLHPFLVERTRVFNAAICKSTNYSSRTELLAKLGRLRVICILRFLFRIQVVEVAEVFIEAMIGGQEFVFVAQMVFPKLARHISHGLE